MHPTFLTVVLALITMVGPLGIDTYLPSFPAIGAEFGVPPAVVQQTLSVYIMGLAVMMLFYGTLSDSFGRRRVMLISMAFFTLFSAFAIFAPSAGALVFIRGLQGLAAGAGIVISRAMVQDRFSGSDAQRITSMIMMVFGIAPALAPLIGGWLQAHFGWRANFVFLTGFTALLLLAAIKGLPETLPASKRQPFHLKIILANYAKTLRHGRFMAMAFAIALVFGGLPLYVGSAAAFVMGILHQPETAFGWLFLPLVGGLVSGSAVAGRLAHSVRMETLIKSGFMVMAVAVTGGVLYNLFFTASVPWAVIPLGVYTFGVALATPGMTVRTMETFPEMRGMASSMQGFVQMMLFAIITGVVAPLIFDSALKIAVAHAVVAFAGIVLWLAVSRQRVVAVAQSA